MWDDIKQQQLNHLRQRELEGTLTTEECLVLESLLRELEQEEWERLQPALERLQTEQLPLRKALGQVRPQNAVLTVLVQRHENLLARARAHLVELLGEHEVLKAEYERITGQPLSASS